MHRSPLFVLLILCAGLPAFEVAEQIAGYRRDGTGIHPGIAPPTAGLREQWVVELPSWGHSSPIVIGERVYLTVEPREGERDFPALLCQDATSGAILWDRPLDHLAAVPAADREPARAAWQAVMQDYAERQRLCRAYRVKEVDDAALAAAGYAYNKRWNKVVASDEKPINAQVKIAAKAGFTLETWRHGCSGGSTNCVGAAYATPVSDGQHIWSCTAWGGFFCHDLDGNPVWTTFDPGDAGEYCRNGRSPILWKGLLISDITNRVRAIDAATGRLVWAHDIGHSHTIVSPMVLTIDDRAVLWSAGCSAYSLPDGKPLTVDGWKEEGMQTLVKYDEPDVIFFCGSGEHCGWTDKGKGKAPFTPPAAVHFALDGDTLRATVLWHGKDVGDSRDISGGNAPWLFYHDGGLYHIKGGIIDAATGAVKAGEIDRSNRNRAVPLTSHLLQFANGHVYGLTNRGQLSVHTTAGGKVAETTVVPPETGINLGWGGKGSVGSAFTLTDGCILVRSHIHLHAIGP